MKYSKEQLEAMSDFDLNKLISHYQLKHDNSHTWFSFSSRGEVFSVNEKTNESALVDYCNKPSDIMPLVIENKINSLVTVNGWMVFSEHDRPLESECENLLRAYAIVYILIKQS